MQIYAALVLTLSVSLDRGSTTMTFYGTYNYYCILTLSLY